MICEILSNEIKHVICEINGCKLQVSEDGTVFRFNKKNEPIIVNNTDNHNGYNQLRCGSKMISRHRIIAYCFLKLNINDPKSFIDHINGNRTDNYVSNLRVVTNQQNQYNQKNAKGYYCKKGKNKYQSQIRANGKDIYLGYFNTEEEACSAYLKAKVEYHKIN